MPICTLQNRGFIEISGQDRKSFLQGLLTNDINKTEHCGLIYSAMLNPVGRFLYDFFIFEKDEKIILECFLPRRDEILRKLNFYKLRAKIEINKNEEFSVFQLFDVQKNEAEKQFSEIFSKEELFIFADSRHQKLGQRIYFYGAIPDFFQKIEQTNLESFFEKEDEVYYHAQRIASKVAEGFYDLTSGEDFILHFGFDDLGAVDYQKGCYVGQETTARMHYRGEIHKKIYHFCIKEFSENLKAHLQNFKNHAKIVENRGLLAESQFEKNLSNHQLHLVKNCEIFHNQKQCGIILSSVLDEQKLSGLALIKSQNQEEFAEMASSLTLFSSPIKIKN